MNLRKFKKIRSEPVNLVLISISLLIFGGLGIIFITQMETTPGWIWSDFQDQYPIDVFALPADDLDKDGTNDIIIYLDIEVLDSNEEEELTHANNPQFGGIIAFNSINGVKIWNKEFEGPVKKVFPIADINSDNTLDYLVSVATVDENWVIKYGFDGKPYKEPLIYFDQFDNFIISGNNGSKIETDANFDTYGIIDCVSLSDLSESFEDFFCLEISNNTIDVPFNVNLTSYFIDGTKKYNKYTGNTIEYKNLYNNPKDIPEIRLYNHNGLEQLIFKDNNNILLLDTANLSYSDPIYNISMSSNIQSFDIIKDLDSDDNFEIFVLTENGTHVIIDIYRGIDGTLLNSFDFQLNYEPESLELKEIGYDEDINEAYIYIRNFDYEEIPSNNNTRVYNEIYVYKIDASTNDLIWEYQKITEQPIRFYALDDDLDGDKINELVLVKEIQPFLSPNKIKRFYIKNVIKNDNLVIIDTDTDVNRLMTIDDFNNDNKKDLLIIGWQRITILSTKNPVAVWLSSDFPFGIPLFILFVAFIFIGILLLIRNSRKLNLRRKEIFRKIKKSKLVIFVNFMTIMLMSITFFLFLLQINIFNQILIAGYSMTDITVAFISVSIIWYGMLPLTAAIFNHFAPHFAFFFIKLRDLFFKISKKYHNDIIVLDMENRTDVGTLIKIQRVILPLLLSIAIGFYSYNTLSPILGYTMKFTRFGSTEFFDFIVGYNLLCILPMILSFILFSFFIAGNYLLDDAGIVYFRQSKKHRKPGDVESISVWSQSMIKGVAGISALVTFFQFLSNVDFSGFFQEEMIIFGTFMVIVIFWGTPFFTAFSYILLSQEIMEFSLEDNTQRLYKKMETKGYVIKPKKLTNLYPSGLPIKNKEDND